MASYKTSRQGDTITVTAWLDGQMHVTNDANPNFPRIMERLFEDDTVGLADLFNAEAAVERRFKQLSERVSVRNGQVYFDGEAIENTLSDHLIRLIHEGEDVSCLVNFWENIAANVSDHSRENLLRWLTAEDFSITEDGMIVGYKGVNADYTSVHAGPGIVNGVPMNAQLPNDVGNLVEIDRSTVTANPRVGCASGLHVGTWGYASSFGQRVVEVHVNPRDVVSVPTDCEGQKMRVCRYRVVADATVKHDAPVRPAYEVDDDFAVSSDWDVL